MTPEAALQAIEESVKRGGDADDVLRDVLAVLSSLHSYASFAFVEDGELVDGPSVGAADSSVARPIRFQGAQVAELRVSEPADAAFLDRVAELVAPYALVGWDTRGEAWEP